eukprot:3419643-Prymnesium_polylepis.1
MEGVPREAEHVRADRALMEAQGNADPCEDGQQYFAQPASSAGVERVFSAAGKMHDDRSASQPRITAWSTRC